MKAVLEFLSMLNPINILLIPLIVDDIGLSSFIKGKKPVNEEKILRLTRFKEIIIKYLNGA